MVLACPWYEALCCMERYVRFFSNLSMIPVHDLHLSHHTYPNKPDVDYPEGFQGNEIPVYGPGIAQLIEDRVAGKA